MKKLLQINTSLFSSDGQSSRLADTFVATWRARHPDTTLAVRDLAREPVPHLDAERFKAFITAPAERTPQQAALAEHADELIRELQEADVVVLGLPMYNFGVPSTLKAYFDHVARAGVTFRYTEQGPEGLLRDKQVYVLAARGGFYVGTPLDSQTGYVRDFFGFLGMKDVEFVYAEGLNIDDDSREAGLNAARERFDALVA
ncbi:FMN-dependent NADH-azoreductase [Acidihalobacter prosperus]|uniref:FMN dependent NADH:quinone oxidoreductase n=1 Tax=Acidihalobacter prosperus TaxID=160660 RepID=A0A1A6C1H7_9GAMM|nr:FMN-dependent NADH-azoreductase [Acidihalobacter prosperus]OBS08417.1 FMN-dependent NADH-azoreductase [Acidihalobacter prosperus]